jgi:hypothetical protein
MTVQLCSLNSYYQNYWADENQNGQRPFLSEIIVAVPYIFLPCHHPPYNFEDIFNEGHI